MNKNLQILYVFCFISLNAIGQNIWTQKTDFGGMARRNAVGFAIGSKGYIGFGYNDIPTVTLMKDIWEYDPVTDAWTQKADYGGTARFSPTAFVIGGNAYIGLGSDQYPAYNFRNDFWKYDPNINVWTQVADFTGTARYEARAFSIGTKGFVGTGWNQGTLFKDFWEYNSVTDAWNQKADFPGSAREAATAFTIGAYGYMGLGLDAFGAKSDFYKYDATLNSWTTISDFPIIDFDAASFVIGNKAYVGSGSTAYSPLNFIDNFWEYNEASDTWTAIANIGGIERGSSVGFAIDSVGYCGTGCYNNATQFLKDFWRYSPNTIGINEIDKNNNVYVYPNPAYNNLNFHLSHYSVDESLTITDILGKEIYYETLSGIDNNISIDGLSSGVYIYKIKDGYEIVSGKIVKE
jgi:N-acetylneuraminic acid mutarotase